ncbi:MAG: ShlB/FhaC/HecB family hemolysin secretion/activation protein [Candidatus Thorarchaeota archaeon]
MKKKLYIFCIFFSILNVYSQVNHSQANHLQANYLRTNYLRTNRLQKNDNPILIYCPKGLILASTMKDLNNCDVRKIDGIKIIGLDIPGRENNFKEKINPLFFKKKLTKQDIIIIKQAIILYYKDHNRPILTVKIPSQSVKDSVLKMLVIEGKIGEINITGNKWTKNKKLEKYVRLKSNQSIDESILIKDLNFINRNPFRHADLVYSPGKLKGTTDINLIVKNRCPCRFYCGVENTGLDILGRNRGFLGINLNNVMGLDNVVSYQYSSGFKDDKFMAHTLQYSAFLPWHHVLYLFGGYSSVHSCLPDIISNKTRGKSIQASMRYNIPLKPGHFFLSEIIFGSDFKRTNNTLDFTEEFPRFGAFVNIFQFMFGYNINYEKKNIKKSLNLEIFISPGKLLPDQSNDRFNKLRCNAKNQYIYATISSSSLFQLYKDFSLSIYLKGQLASCNLLPSEQLGIGGSSTVRGYEERQLNGDNGILINLELRSFPISIFKFLMKSKIKDGFQILGFLDYGLANLHKPASFEKNNQYLLGAGPGVRYSMGSYLSFRLDLGYKLHKKSEYGGGNSMIHFSLVSSF